MATTRNDEETWVWDWDRGEVVSRIPDDGPWEIAFDQRGSRIASKDRTLGHRDRRAGDGTDYVTFDPDGTTIAASLEDSTVRLYDAQTYEQQLVLRGDIGSSPWIDFSPDGSMLVSGDGYGVMKVWALDIDDLLEIARREVTRSLTDEECRQYLHVDRCSAAS